MYLYLLLNMYPPKAKVGEHIGCCELESKPSAQTTWSKLELYFAPQFSEIVALLYLTRHSAW